MDTPDKNMSSEVEAFSVILTFLTTVQTLYHICPCIHSGTPALMFHCYCLNFRSLVSIYFFLHVWGALIDTVEQFLHLL